MPEAAAEADSRLVGSAQKVEMLTMTPAVAIVSARRLTALGSPGKAEAPNASAPMIPANRTYRQY
jgi:hypothetical protein